MFPSQSRKRQKSPSELNALCDAIAESWHELSALPRPVPDTEQPRVDSLLSDLAQLNDLQMLPLWESGLPTSACALTLFDYDYDGRDELLVLCNNGEVLCYQEECATGWRLLAPGRIPGGTGPVIGFEVQSPASGEMQIARVVTAGAQAEEGDRLFEIVDHSPTGLGLHPRPAHRHGTRRLMIGCRSGELEANGLVSVAVVTRLGEDSGLLLRATPLLGSPHEIPLNSRPSALAHTTRCVWLGDSHERIRSWRWSGSELQPAPGWPENGLPVDGRITALALWPRPDETWLLIVATDERCLIAADESGRIVGRIPTPHVVTALTPVPASGRLWMSLENKRLRLLRPVWPPLLVRPFPSIPETFQCLPLARRGEIQQSWLQSDDSSLVGAAVQGLLDDLAAGKPEAERYLQHLSRPDADQQPREHVVQALAALESAVLTAGGADTPLLRACLRMARSLYPRFDLRLRWRIDLLTARVAACLDEDAPGRTADYHWLREARRKGDRAFAQLYFKEGRLEAALNLFAEMLIQRRHTAWVFSASRAIRALVTLPGSPQALLATRAGDVFQVDLAEKNVVTQPFTLPEGAIPRTIAVGPLTSPDALSVALVTVQGHLYLGPAAPDRCVEELKLVHQADHDVWSLAMIPPSSDEPHRLILSSGGGSLMHYAYEPGSDRWHRQKETELPAEWLYSVIVDSLEPGQTPLILAGGAESGGTGIVFLLDLTGRERYAPLRFAGPVLDIRTVQRPEQLSKAIAVACADGYLYLRQVNGVCLWRYRVGSAARSLAVFDIDDDGEEEIIVGGEADGDTVNILDQEGTVRWVIPAKAAVTHVAATRHDGMRSQLLIADVEHTLQVVEVNPPDSPQESEIRQQAKACLATLATKERTSEEALEARWLTAAPTPFLRGYAFYHCADRVSAGEPTALEHLVDADVRGSEAIVQRAYARALVNAATALDRDPAIAEAIIARLAALLKDPDIRTAGNLGAAAMRQLSLADRSSPVHLKDWAPALCEAARHPQAEVRRAALHALRSAHPATEEAADLRPEAWEVLRTSSSPGCDDEEWVREEVAGLLRATAGDNDDLWELSHRVLAELVEPAVLKALGQQEPRRLDSPALANAIDAMAELSKAPKLRSVGQPLTRLKESIGKIETDPDRKRSGRLLEIYRAVGEAVDIPNREHWERFVTDRTPLGGLGRLSELLEGAGDAAARVSKQLRPTRQAIRDFLETPANANNLSHLINTLTHQADLLVTLPERDQLIDRLKHFSPLSTVLAGLLWGWCRPGGPLNRWLEELTRPAEPALEVGRCILRRDELLLEVHLWNPGQNPIEELNLRLRKARVIWDHLELNCLTDPGVSTDSLALDPQGKHQLRLHVPVIEAARRSLTNLPGQEISATLRLPVTYFQPPKDWVNKKLEKQFTFCYSISAKLEWRRDLPRAWKRLEPDLSRELKDRSTEPVLIECAPVARESLIEEIHHPLTRGPGPCIVNLREWLFAHLGLQASGLRTDEATLLAWLAERCWPAAGERVEGLRTAGAPRHAFREFAHSQDRLGVVILNNWDRLLVGIARRREQWGPLDGVVPFLVEWAREIGTRLIFVGSFLTEQIASQRWPQIASRFKIIRCDHLGVADARMRQELVDGTDRVLGERNLHGVLRRFDGTPTVRNLVSVCGGYLHVLDHVALPALEEVRPDRPAHVRDLEDYLVDYAHRMNFFNSLWMWQSFFERLATVLVAHGEIPLEQRGWAEVGMTLSRDYHARRPNGRLVKPATLPAGKELGEQEVQTIRVNEYYRSGDVGVRGFAANRPAPQDWGPPGELFLQLLRAGGGDQLLDRLVDGRILLRHRTRHLGVFYTFAVPLYEQWLRTKGIWEHMKAATEESQETWYPMELAYDQRHEVEARRLLFPDLQSGMAHRDLPLSSFLPAIDRQLDKSTRSMFLNMYGLSGRSRTDTQTRWNGLVSLADALNSWRRNLPTAGADQETARNLFKGLRILLDLRLSGWSGDVPGKIALDRLPGEEGPLLPWAYAEVRDPVEVLRKQVLLIVIGDGTAAAESAPVLRAWARERFSDLHHDQRKDLDETDFGQALERSVVIAVVLEGIPALKSALPPGYGGPHFILLDMPDLTEIVIQPNPAQKLLTRAFEDIGRRSFTPYKLAGSLPGGSDLFVGRENEVQTILGSLDREDHAILGSRRIGKTSLLQAVEYRLRERDRQVPALFLRLKDHSDVKDFYSQLKWALGGIGHGKLADRLSDAPGTEHADLYEVMHTLAEKFGHPVVVLMDEVDGLYLWDLHQNQERLFQFLRNNLAQSTPRLCTFVMTGFRHIYLNRLNAGSVFYNFCRFQNLLGVERESVGHLVRMLKGFNIKIEEEAEVIGLVEHGTYAIPYYVQRACDNLLRRVDRLGQNSIGPADAQAVLDQDIRALLKRELWDDLNVDPLLVLTGPEGSREDRRNQLLKVKSLLLATIITHYEYKSRPETAQVTPAGGQPTFTAKEAIDYLNELWPDAWPATERAVDRLLRALTMTLALAPAAEDRWAYLFPNDILPDVLYFYERQGTMNLIDELDGIVRALKELPSA